MRMDFALERARAIGVWTRVLSFMELGLEEDEGEDEGDFMGKT